MICKKTMFKYIDWTPKWATKAERSKVNLDLLNLFIAIVSLGIPQFSKKSTFQKCSHLNALESKFDLDIK